MRLPLPPSYTRTHAHTWTPHTALVDYCALPPLSIFCSPSLLLRVLMSNSPPNSRHISDRYTVQTDVALTNHILPDVDVSPMMIVQKDPPSLMEKV
jgi:hypothetical protein